MFQTSENFWPAEKDKTHKHLNKLTFALLINNLARSVLLSTGLELWNHVTLSSSEVSGHDLETLSVWYTSISSTWFRYAKRLFIECTRYS